ncbi:hypothetical protein [Sphingopyxis sp. JAI128]|uniref:hypothetical protein n=1 Tax=Sphingopyxis sp. JAI128 TaxID=2723066 RepID=UPI00160E51E3|nr:hypothetical protein [Sphingopyxis sp. JAI128]MBB6425307.1 hypothetical protein [Sphingopyxis sp. JAI128]
MPFYSRSEVRGDEAGPLYIPAGAYLPPRVPQRRYDGPGRADYHSVAALKGLLLSVAPGADWLVRGGLFRSLYDDTIGTLTLRGRNLTNAFYAD